MLIISTLDHTSEVFAHLSSCCADLSSLTKITDRETLHLVMKGHNSSSHPVQCPGEILEPSGRRKAENTRGKTAGKAEESPPPETQHSGYNKTT